MPAPHSTGSAFPRITAIEVAVELNNGERALYRLEDPEVSTFDRTETAGALRVRFDATGRPRAVTSRYPGMVVRRR